jgi:molecular chaperone DnaK
MNEIRAAQEELNKAFSEAGQSFYAQNQASSSGGTEPPSGGDQGGGAPGAAGGTPPEDVVEADYEIVDEGKK